MSVKVGALVIGQAPRPDLVGPLAALLPDCEIVQAGALDRISAETIPPTQARYPLSTRLADGTPVLVEESYIAAKLQDAVTRLETAGVSIIYLCCAGTFANLHSCVPLLKPFVLLQQVLATIGARTIGLYTPVAEQIEPMRERWVAAGYATRMTEHLNVEQLNDPQAIVAALLANQDDAAPPDCIVLDYIGLPTPFVDAIAALSPVPVLDLSNLSIRIVASLITHPSISG